MKRIIDISYWQDPSKIDYDKLAAQVDGVIIRCAYGVRKDTAFDRHYQELSSRGVPCGAYHFLVQFKSVDEQLAVVRQAVSGKNLKAGIWLDVELESGADALTRSQVIEFMTKAEAEFGELGIYTGRWCWNPIMGTTNNPYSSRKLWVGSYTTSPYMPYGWDDWFIWQYTSSGRLDGYAGNLDMNRITDENWQAWIGDTIPDTINALELPLLSQKDDRWASERLGTSAVTIGAYGCLLTASAMIARYFGKNTDPKRLNADLVKVDGYESGNLLKYASVTVLYPDIQVDWNKFTTNPPDALIDEVLMQEIPVIAQVDYNPDTSVLEQHWVVIIGKDANGYLIADPIDGTVSNLSRYGGKLYRMVVYEQVAIETPLFKAKCIVGGLNVRSGASTLYDKVGLLVEGDIVNVYEVSNNWFRIGEDMWCSGYPQYMEVIDIEPQPPVLTLEERVARLELEVFGED